MSNLKNLINVDMIESFIDVNNLTIFEFCQMCEISEEDLFSILNRNLTSLPYYMEKISKVIDVPMNYLVNFDLIKKYYSIFKF